jgi:hypothetical protein
MQVHLWTARIIHTPVQTALLHACHIARHDFPQQTSEKAEIGGFRTKNYPNPVVSGVLRVTFHRAAAATPERLSRIASDVD